MIYYKISISIILSLVLRCVMGTEENKQKNIMSNTSLIEGINISESFIKNIELKQYKYKGIYIEDLKLNSFQKKEFCIDFFNFLKEQQFEKEEYAQVFFIKLLLVCIQQKDESILYDILNNIFKDGLLGYYLEDYSVYLYQLFLYKPSFFIKNAYKYGDSSIVEYINNSLPNTFFTKEKTIKNNLGEIKQDGNNMLLISEKQVELFSLIKLKNSIKKQSAIEVFYSPSFNTGWKEKIAVYYNIYDYINEKILTSLTTEERKYFEKNNYPMFENYIIKNRYEVYDSDGYANLREGKSSSSKILGTILSGENVEVLDDKGDWWLVESSNNRKGYVHKSRLRLVIKKSSKR
ncbi:SH3 domain-containing protein [Capnocytophaga catalasegens]|uniref:SH3b domain-containing protein n=2 Tax=Capnocytophaga catalasegens TaxID=1004260 RepID=A0AAV5AWV0_9FLAO|nr:SH3 domain-containing protein [Capnocytophaga catalasegens]GIZ16379.1 hypothetical protein RCZ03_23790 [Capnocytophaga catalasegens]GJM49117.1 hypothetical protein RCZ15_00930 [Capnocytophaga catalasegens]GJM53352.1 hypothetical protein RCZ16_16690 [Capnocytophaga catalasegens]